MADRRCLHCGELEPTACASECLAQSDGQHEYPAPKPVALASPPRFADQIGQSIRDARRSRRLYG